MSSGPEPMDDSVEDEQAVVPSDAPQTEDGKLVEREEQFVGEAETVHKSGIIPKIQNVVATVNLGCTLDLKQIAQRARNAEYNPKRFSAVIMRIRDPKTTALIFQTGKVVVTGGKSEKMVRLAARKYARIIQKIGFPDVKFEDFKIQNIVGSADVKFPIRLEGIVDDHADYSSYEPEMFPGLVYRMVQPKIVMLIFVSGKVVLTGAKTRADLYEAFESIYPVLLEFRKDSHQPPSSSSSSSQSTTQHLQSSSSSSSSGYLT